MLPEKKRYENMILALHHSMAQLRDKINRLLEVEMKKIKEQLLEFDK